MERFTHVVFPDFDFSHAETFTVTERLDRCIERARRLSADYPMPKNIPPVSNAGATSDEIDRLEAAVGVPIPAELRMFWSRCRYLCLDDGMNIGGFDHRGVHVSESVWLSTRHLPGQRFLVVGAYWRFADGDQLLIDLDDPTYPVIAYLHEHGPLFERYAPSFSLALWRLVHETD